MDKCCRTCKYFELGKCTNCDVPIAMQDEIEMINGNVEDVIIFNDGSNLKIRNPEGFSCNKYE